MARQHLAQRTDADPQSSLVPRDGLHRPLQVGEPLPAVCLVPDVAQVLRVSESRVYQLRREGKLRDFLLPALDGTLRFNGKLLSAYRDGTFEPRGLRMVGRKVR